jgi:hypothetical protein
MNNDITDIFKFLSVLLMLLAVTYKIGELIVVGFRVLF